MFLKIYLIYNLHQARAGFPECVKLLKAYNNFTEQVNSTTIKYVQMKEEIYPRIVAATIDKLIQQLCYEKYTGFF